MSKIVLKVAEPVTANQAIAAIRTVTDQSVADIKHALCQGGILSESLLFMNDHEECAEKLLQLISVLQKNHVSYRLYELEPDEHYEAAALPPKYEISEEVLHNILDSHQQGILRQQRLAEQGL